MNQLNKPLLVIFFIMVAVGIIADQYIAANEAAARKAAVQKTQTDQKPTETLKVVATRQPQPSLVQVDEPTAHEACKLMARWAFTSCGHGYIASGGNKDEKSAEYKFVYPMCVQAAQVAFELCMGNAIQAYIGKTGKGQCGDMGLFQEDVINLSCEISVNAGADKAYLKKCATWAKAGSLNFIAWCTEQETKRLQPTEPKKPTKTSDDVSI